MKRISKKEFEKILDAHKVHVSTLGKGGVQANLRGANLRGANLIRVVLAGADLEGADLTEVDLTRANLEGTNLTEANLTRADLTRANLTRADLIRANLREANLAGAVLAGADLAGAVLARAVLAGADLTKADLTGADLTEANLTGADLTKADLTEAVLRKANVTGANFTGADLTKADLTGVDFTRAKGADLTKATNLEESKVNDVSNVDEKRYTKRAEDAQREISRLQREITTLQANNQKDSEVEIATRQAEIATQKEVKDTAELQQTKREDLNSAVNYILKAVKADKDLIERYKSQSTRLLRTGLGLFLGVLCYALFIAFAAIFWEGHLKSIMEGYYSVLLLLSPSFIGALIATGLLRHDWKIRQLTQQLIQQNNQIDIAMGTLRASLELSSIKDIPDIVHESFKDVRKGLLFNSRTISPISEENDQTDSQLVKVLEQIVKKK